MRVISALQDISKISFEQKRKDLSIGLVPTMGALHEGHLHLVRRSLDENDKTVVSIFVNPLQFDNEEDLVNYPNTMDQDISMLRESGADFLFKPSDAEFYPSKPTVRVSFGDLASSLEGEFRPGHFEGVGVVVSKLFHVVTPTRAYFGLKDLQQYLLVRKMVEDLSFPIEIIGCETRREPSGLAMSSRNKRLSTSGLLTASEIYRGLEMSEVLIREKTSPAKVIEQIATYYETIKGLEVEYLKMVDGMTLRSLKDYDSVHELAVCFAGYVDGIRLIDNLYLRLNS